MLAIILGAVCMTAYAARVNWVLSHTPEVAAKRAGDVIPYEKIRMVYERIQKNGIQWSAGLTAEKGRRYIVVGGSGKSNQDGWIMDLSLRPPIYILLWHGYLTIWDLKNRC